MSNRREIEPEYIYITIPKEYVCVYHRILVMLADYGEEMLKDCKATCTERNSTVIECFNMFNAAVAAHTLGQEKKATLLINYIKAKINQIYKGEDNSPGFVFPVDENGILKAFVSCNDLPRFFVEDNVLYKQDQNLGYIEQYSLRDEIDHKSFVSPFDFDVEATVIEDIVHVNVKYKYDGVYLNETEQTVPRAEYYIDGDYIPDLNVYPISKGTHKLMVFAYYKGGVNHHNYVIDNY